LFRGAWPYRSHLRRARQTVLERDVALGGPADSAAGERNDPNPLEQELASYLLKKHSRSRRSGSPRGALGSSLIARPLEKVRVVAAFRGSYKA